ncbi:MAG: hypothetical protein AAF901_11725, partial [Bacteroidota bacterium]
LLFTVALMGLTAVTASEQHAKHFSNGLDITSRYDYSQPILFVERGVEFLIFADGSFDFNTELGNPNNGDYYYKRSSASRNLANGTFGAPGSARYHHGGRGVLVTHDRLGRVRRIGNVFINYDRQGRIKRAGTVYMTYRRGLLRQVSGLHIQYNRRGQIVGTQGFVNLNNQGCGLIGTNGHDVGQFGYDNLDWGNDWDDNDDDYYYYRRDGKTYKHKRR